MFFQYACVLLFLLLVGEINSQGTEEDYDDYPRRPPSIRPSADCNCIEIRRCKVLIDRRDWKTAGETCEYGHGRYRKVCCPSRSTPIATPPPPPRPVTPVRIPPIRPGGTKPKPDVVTFKPPPPPVTPVRIPPIRPGGTKPKPDFVTFKPPVSVTDRVQTTIQGGCGQSVYESDLKPLIMGGQNATEGMWPWMAAIVKRETTGIYTPWCTGFLIDKIHVMSAAHCFETLGNDRYRTRIGNINQNIADEYRVTRISNHAGYKPKQFYDDIAILTLDREVDFPNFNPICLPDEVVSKMELTRRGTTVAGWGADRYGGQLKTHLQYLKGLPVISNQECHRRLRRTLLDSFQGQFPRGVTKGFICAGFNEGGKDACGGDSGGPLMIMHENRWYAIGVVSFGFRCGIPGMPGGYTRISSHLNWINQTTRN